MRYAAWFLVAPMALVVLVITGVGGMTMVQGIRCHNRVHEAFVRIPPETEAQNNIIKMLETRWTFQHGCEARVVTDPWRKVK